MKKTLILAFITLLAITTVKAQDESKAAVSGDGFSMADIFVSGSVSFGTDNDGNLSSNQFNFSPQVGYFIDDYIAIGGRFGYVSSTGEIASIIDPNATIDDKTTTLNIGAFGRYYFTPENNFSFFGELAAGISNIKREVGQAEGKGNGWFINAAPGINYFLSYNFAIEASVGLIGYDSFKIDEENADTQSAFNIGVNLSDINLGVVYRF